MMPLKGKDYPTPIDSENLEHLIEERERTLEDFSSKRTPWGKNISHIYKLVRSGTDDDEGDSIKFVQYLSPSGSITTYQDAGTNVSGSNVGVPFVPVIISMGKGSGSGKSIIGSSRKSKSRQRKRSGVTGRGS